MREDENLKEALQYLVGTGSKINMLENRVIEINGRKYITNSNLTKIKEPQASPLTVRTLTALVDYITYGTDIKRTGRLMIHVAGPTEVNLYSELDADRDREHYLSCKIGFTEIPYGRYMDVEEFNIMLQSRFVRNDDCAILLQVTGNVKDENVKTVGDDGVAQSVTMKTGVAQVSTVIVPNPVNLAPYRTFPEIFQPESKFIFRMKSGPQAAIFEADGGAWKNDAVNMIKAYLAGQFVDKDWIYIIA